MDAPGIAKDKDGRPLADRALNMGLPVLRKNGTKGYTTLRGFGPKGVALRPEFHMVAGRMFQTGKRELIVGAGAQVHVPAHEDRRQGDPAQWRMADRRRLYHRRYTGWPADRRYRDHADGAEPHTAYNSILVRLTSQDALGTFRRRSTTNPALQVTVTRHSDWYKKVSDQATGLLAVLAYVVGAVMAVGALFGCLNTMYAAVSTRAREIATLRALGYGAFPVAVSVILECDRAGGGGRADRRGRRVGC